MDSTLSDLPLNCIKGIGPKKAAIFGRIGIRTVRDALYYLPCRYEDRSKIRPMGDIREGPAETVRGRIVSCELVRPRGKKFRIFEILVSDGTGTVKGRWFNQPFMQRNLKAGQDVLLWGEVKRDRYFGAGYMIDGPEYEIVSEDAASPIHANRIVPIYRLTEGISQKHFRKIMFGIVEEFAKGLTDPVPYEIIEKHGLPPLRHSIEALHFPAECEIALWNKGESIYHKRLAFNELFTLELGMAVLHSKRELRKGHSFRCKGRLRLKLEENLPFSLTNAQKRVLREILGDMERPVPMQRLVQGDVGCGKTVVAFSAMLNAVESGFQTAFMAPTAILADQHYRNICGMAEDLGMKIALLTGSVKDRQLGKIASGEVNVAVGTHALIEGPVTFRRLGMIVIDEQHKFGVAQRGRLRQKGANPDILVMTATPIPRSLALTVYGDLDYSVIDEMPGGRRPVETKVLLPGQKEEIYGILEEEINRGRQAYVVYPAIEESENSDLRAAVQGKLAYEKIFPSFRVGLLHGGTSSVEKDAVMRAFTNGEIDLLVSTSVIEVGVDVPNATLMLIIHAERFGLAQLHQLRGRVGRGAEASRCLLVAYGPLGEEASRRLDVMIRTSDGFQIAQEDLAIRGPGEFFGHLQAGMPDLRVADLLRDLPILEAAKNEAFALYDVDPGLRGHPTLRKSCESFWNDKIDFVGAG